MKLLITNIIYKENTREWTINIDSLKAYNEYQSDERTDKSIWRFGDFMSFNTTPPEQIEIEVPFDNYLEHITEIDDYVQNYIKNKTTREVKSFIINELAD